MNIPTYREAKVCGSEITKYLLLKYGNIKFDNSADYEYTYISCSKRLWVRNYKINRRHEDKIDLGK